MPFSPKKNYFSPEIVAIVLDNEISLALQSAPPEGTGEGAMLIQEHLSNDPFKTQIG